MQRFRGEHEHTIDGKGRMSIPSGFRMLIQEHSDHAPILHNAKTHLVLYPYDVWEKAASAYEEFDEFSPEAQSLERQFFGKSADCPIDKNGRILIPLKPRADAALEGKVTVLGIRNRVEIWNPTRCADHDNATAYNRSELQRQAGQILRQVKPGD